LLIVNRGQQYWNPFIEASKAKNALLNIYLFSSTILWSQSTCVPGFGSLIVNSIISKVWNDSSAYQTNTLIFYT